MNICFPVAANEGLESPVYGHFGSAPLFLLIDTDTAAVAALDNCDLHHAHGQCSPLRALGEAAVDAIVVGGIGGGALRGLQAAGLKVYRAAGATVADNLAMLASAGLPEVLPGEACGGHGHGHGCGH